MNLIEITKHNTPSQAQECEYAIGIDLGTTNSLIGAAHKKGRVKILKDNTNNKLIPSAIHIDAQHQITIGNEAIAKKEPHNTIFSIKRLMGSVQNNQQQISLHNGDYSAVELSALILKHLKSIAESHIQTTVTKAIITVPAYFGERARQATKEAALLAGIEPIRLLNEPTAAGISYGIQNKKEAGQYIVYDLGGGTFDVSILKLFQGAFKVEASSGSLAIGGDDYDNSLAQAIISKYNIDPKDVVETNIKQLAQTVKHKLNKKDPVTAKIQTKNKSIMCSITREEFILSTQQHTNKTVKIIQEMLNNLDIEEQTIDGMLLVGGSTRMFTIKQALQQNFHMPIIDSLHPDEAVVRGATLHCKHLLFKEDHLLLDVTPLSLGIEVMGGLVEKIIKRNSPIPSKHTKQFTTYCNNQTAISIRVCQGESNIFSSNELIAELSLENLPPMNAGEPIINVTFEMDVDGLLTVTATEESSKIQKVIMVNSNHQLNRDKIITKIQDSMYDLPTTQNINTSLCREAKLLLSIATQKTKDYLPNPTQIEKINQDLQAAIMENNETIIKSIIKQLRELLTIQT